MKGFSKSINSQGIVTLNVLKLSTPLRTFKIMPVIPEAAVANFDPNLSTCELQHLYSSENQMFTPFE